MSARLGVLRMAIVLVAFSAAAPGNGAVAGSQLFVVTEGNGRLRDAALERRIAAPVVEIRADAMKPVMRVFDGAFDDVASMTEREVRRNEPRIATKATRLAKSVEPELVKAYRDSAMAGELRDRYGVRRLPAVIEIAGDGSYRLVERPSSFAAAVRALEPMRYTAAPGPLTLDMKLGRLRRGEEPPNRGKTRKMSGDARSAPRALVRDPGRALGGFIKVGAAESVGRTGQALELAGQTNAQAADEGASGGGCLAFPQNDSSIDRADWASWAAGADASVHFGGNSSEVSIRDGVMNVDLVPNNQGSQRVNGGYDLPPSQTYTLDNSFRFEDGFDFGGVLETGKIGWGLGGGSRPTGGNQARDGWTARLVWQGDGYTGRNGSPSYRHLAVYAYNSSRGTTHGEFYPVRGFELRAGEWIDTRMEVTVNDPGQSNGSVRVWVNSVLLLDSGPTILWQAEGVPTADFLLFTTLFGGNSDLYRPSGNTGIDFRAPCYSPSGLPPEQVASGEIIEQVQERIDEINETYPGAVEVPPDEGEETLEEFVEWTENGTRGDGPAEEAPVDEAPPAAIPDEGEEDGAPLGFMPPASGGQEEDDGAGEDGDRAQETSYSVLDAFIDASSSDSFDCIDARITGACVYVVVRIYCSPFGCSWEVSVDTSAIMSHYNPDFLIATYRHLGDSPIEESKALYGELQNEISAPILELLTGEPVPELYDDLDHAAAVGSDGAAGNPVRSTMKWFESEVIGHPGNIYGGMSSGDLVPVGDMTDRVSGAPKNVMEGTRQLMSEVSTDLGDSANELTRGVDNVSEEVPGNENASATFSAVGIANNTFVRSVAEMAGAISGYGATLEGAYDAWGEGAAVMAGDYTTLFDGVLGEDSLDQFDGAREVVDGLSALEAAEAVEGGGDTEATGDKIEYFSFCPPDPDFMKPYQLSGLDLFQHRFNIPEIVDWRTYAVPYLNPDLFVGEAPMNTWGPVYPRTGWILQPDPLKAAAVAGYRAAHAVTRPDQPHVYLEVEERETPYLDVTHPLALDPADPESGRWQLVAPELEAMCYSFGEEDTISEPWSADRQSDDGNYAFTHWRPYSCCPEPRPAGSAAMIVASRFKVETAEIEIIK